MYTCYAIIKDGEWVGSRAYATSAMSFADKAFEKDRSSEYWVIPYPAMAKPDTDAMSLKVIYAIGSC